jgi:hypothetical protein
MNLTMKGRVKVVSRNAITGEIVDQREYEDNQILAGYLNTFFKGYRPLLINSSGPSQGYDSRLRMYYCAIGTDGTLAIINDTGIKGTRLSYITGTDVTIPQYMSYPLTLTREFVFPAGCANGTICEAVIYDNIPTSSSSVALARFVFNPGVIINDVTQVEITWSFIFQRSADSWSGIIVGGQRDGNTNINWTATINNKQLWRWACGDYYDYNAGYIAPLPWGQDQYNRLTRMATIGTSNAPSDLVNDSEDMLKGNAIATNNLPSLTSIGGYTDNSFYRDVTYGWDINECNGDWGELILSLYFGASGYTHQFSGAMRITFNPALNKQVPDSQNGWRLYLTIRTSITPG